MLQVISIGAFARVVRAGDSKRFGVNLKADRAQILGEAAQEALTQPPILSPIKKTKIRGRTCYSYQRYADHLVVRSIGRYLRRRLRVLPLDRNLAIAGVIQAASEGGQYSIVRRDISDFYETIDPSALRERLLFDPIVTPRVRDFLVHFFSQHDANPGIPRGVGLSAILAELYMESFDRVARQAPGVFRYYRYADDIIAFTSGDPTDLAGTLETALPAGMTFNAAKSTQLDAQQIAAGSAGFEYLGYSFQLSLPPNKRDRGRQVHVGISEKKLKRMKSRVIRSIDAFTKDGDFSLLNDRIRFLSSNYEVRRNGASGFAGATHVRSGIYYNYKHCGIYTVGKDGLIRKSDWTGNDLKRLDGMVRALLFGRSDFAPKVAALPGPQRELLRTYSFFRGYHSRMLMRVRPHRVAEIKSVWRNV